MPFRQHHSSPGMLKIMLKCFPKSNINHFMNSSFKVSHRVPLCSRVIKSQRKGLRSLSAPPMKQEITPVTFPNPTWPWLMGFCHFSLFDFTEDSTRLFPLALWSPQSRHLCHSPPWCAGMSNSFFSSPCFLPTTVTSVSLTSLQFFHDVNGVEISVSLLPLLTGLLQNTMTTLAFLLLPISCRMRTNCSSQQ